ncbi:pathogenesis-related protein PRB1-3-like [Cucurbita maxima]|uniref:Pathogenesis-related protein PRB1-3-like n=1 Tax=Cucurbita maxima TaxID=3661 RepID=A0A6J1JL37_CUCMA|nr:pathogenesis-related protein PRB1-3-like [Cucurbita maxima]
MDLFKLSLSLFCVASVAMLPSTLAQDTPQDFVNAHNAARALVGVGPVQWDATVASYAQQYANLRINDCQLIHSGGPYGENIAWGSSNLSGTAAVQLWVAEKQYYNYNTNSCAAGKVCGHYTQVVWRNSVRIGCAKVICANNAGTFITCNYDPRGNIIGQMPY